VTGPLSYRRGLLRAARMRKIFRQKAHEGFDTHTDVLPDCVTDEYLSGNGGRVGRMTVGWTSESEWKKESTWGRRECYEYNVDIRNIFIDYMHASDSIKRNKILDSLTQNKIPFKLIKLIKLTLENTTAKVKVKNAYTMEFRVESGVKQGDPLSPTLFSLAIDTVLKKNWSER